jgi:uncharacterized MnhB-related membrane protein
MIVVAVGILVCAIMAIRVNRLLHSALWLAGTSALVALMLYMLGAPEIAVIELSVGAGLVTVLFVFAINIAGEEKLTPGNSLPKWLVILGLVLVLGLLALMNLPFLSADFSEQMGLTFLVALWHNRYLDLLLQLVLVFGGVMAMLGLLTDDKAAHSKQTEEK